MRRDPFTGNIQVMGQDASFHTLDPATGAPVLQPFDFRNLGATNFFPSIGELLVTHRGNGGGIAVVDRITGAPLSFFAFQDLTSPDGITVVNGKIYVSNNSASGRFIAVYDEDTKELLEKFEVNERPTKMAALSRQDLKNYLAMPFAVDPIIVDALGEAGPAAGIRGIAVTNASPSAAEVTVEYHEASGPDSSPMASPPQNASAAALDLGAGEQVAVLLTDLFESDPDVPGWIELTSDTPNPDYARDLNPSEIWVQKKSRSSLI